jgi:hypothetical protein
MCTVVSERHDNMALHRTSAASSTITANRTAEHTNKDQVFAVASQRLNNVTLQDLSCFLNLHHKQNKRTYHYGSRVHSCELET